jgi:hypothetical protein
MCFAQQIKVYLRIYSQWWLRNAQNAARVVKGVALHNERTEEEANNYFKSSCGNAQHALFALKRPY